MTCEVADRGGDLVGTVLLQEVRGALDQHRPFRVRNELDECPRDRVRQYCVVGAPDLVIRCTWMKCWLMCNYRAQCGIMLI